MDDLFEVVMSTFLNILAICFAYFFFCVLAVDPNRRAFIYVGSPWIGFSFGGKSWPDPTYKFTSLGAAIPTILLATLAMYNERYCLFDFDHILSWQSLFSTLTVLVVGNIFFGPSFAVRKSLQLRSQGVYRRSLSLIIYDKLMLIPYNVLVAGSLKLVIAAVTGLVFLVATLTQIVSQFHISMAVIIVWVIMCLGRVSAIVTLQGIRLSFSVLLYLGMILACAVVWELVEKALKGCGVPKGQLPSLTSLLANLSGVL